MRLQIPAYTDMWMRGDRYGELVKVSQLGRGKGTHIARETTSSRYFDRIEVAHVRLDKSGKTVRVPLIDCTPISH